MYGAKAIAIDLMLGSRPRHHELLRERYVSKYPAPHLPPTNESAPLQPTERLQAAITWRRPLRFGRNYRGISCFRNNESMVT